MEQFFDEIEWADAYFEDTDGVRLEPSSELLEFLL